MELRRHAFVVLTDRFFSMSPCLRGEFSASDSSAASLFKASPLVYSRRRSTHVTPAGIQAIATMPPLDSATHDSFGHDWDAREVRLREVVTDRLKENPPPAVA